MGLVLAYLFLPIVNALAGHMPRPVAILIVYVGGIALIIGAIAYVVPPVVIQTVPSGLTAKVLGASAAGFPIRKLHWTP